MELLISRKRFRLVSEPEVNQFSSVFPGILENWSSCRSCFIDHHLFVHQLILLMLNPWTILPSNDSGAAAPEYQKLPGSVNATTSSATMRGRVTAWHVFSRAIHGVRVNSQDHSRSQVHMSKQLNGKDKQQHKLKTKWT